MSNYFWKRVHKQKHFLPSWWYLHCKKWISWTDKNMFCVNPTSRTLSCITKNNESSAYYIYIHVILVSKWILSNCWHLIYICKRTNTHTNKHMGRLVWCWFKICCLHIISAYCQILRSLKFLLIVMYGNSFFF